MLIKLAFRNLFRNFRRTVLTFSAIAFGVMMLNVADSVLNGIDSESFRKIIELESGHIRLFAKGYRDDIDNYPLDKAIASPEAIIARLEKDPDIEGITSRLSFRVMLSDGKGELPAVGYAVDTRRDASVFKLNTVIQKGQFLKGSTEAILVGSVLAKDFNIGEGDYLTLLTRTRHDTYQALDLRVQGIIMSEDPKIDYSAAVIPLELAKKALDMGGSVTEIDIKLKDPKKSDEVRDRIAKEFKGIDVATWKDFIEDVKAVGEAKRKSRGVLFASLFLIALIGIANTILLSAFERTREIGMMAALGMRRSGIRKLFILEGAMIGFIGSLAGCILGALIIILYLVPFGIDISGMKLGELGDFGYRMTDKMYGEWNLSMVIATFFMGVIVSALTSIYPAWVASKMEPTEALRKT